MKKSILFFFILFTSLSSIAMPNDLEINKTCQKIFNDLKRAKGMAINQLPFLELVDVLPNPRFTLAMAVNDTKMIYLENKTARLAIRSMGAEAENGIAYILAHELSHLTRQHNVKNKFISRFQKGFLQAENSSSGMAANSEEVQTFINNAEKNEYNHNIRKNEAEADLDAGFTAFLAGYETKVAGPAFLQLVYDDFKLNPTPKTYASLIERKEIIRLTGERIDTLVRVYEMGNYLTAAGEYSAAYDCYHFVSNEISSPALLNNLGVTSLLEVSEMIKPSDVKYILPLTLDLGRNGSKDVDLETRKEAYRMKIYLLEDAIVNFEHAASLNNNYYQAHINMSIAYYLKYVVKNKEKTFSKFIFDDLNFGLSEALKAKQIIINQEQINNKSLADTYTQMAIMYKELGMPNLSTRFIKKALDEFPTSFTAQSNQEILNNQTQLASLLESQTQSPFKKCMNKESVYGGASLDDLLYDTPDDSWDIKIAIKNKKSRFLTTSTYVKFMEDENYLLYNIFKKIGTQSSELEYTFYVPKSNQSKTSACGIKPQNNKSDVNAMYGVESRSIETDNNSIMRFIDNASISDGFKFYDGILFVIDGTQKVEKWIAFQIAKEEKDD